ncbi:MAG TPA: hypothetical protein VJS37_14780, partial [Terriglobales bacterium]|nr:hypothetical protein [Terriglobales bacterium]
NIIKSLDLVEGLINRRACTAVSSVVGHDLEDRSHCVFLAMNGWLVRSDLGAHLGRANEREERR